MPFLSWRRDYQVGVAQIDDEHRGLFDLINQFHDSCAHNSSDRELTQMLNRLVAYAEEHFQHEEKLMSDNDYPQLDAHRELHAGLVSTIFAINERRAVDKVRASAEILPFVKNWLVSHIVRSDMDIADFLRRRARQDQVRSQAEEQPPGKSEKEAEQS